ncbi:hypothetical protein [Microbacterium hydrocarbonoxydans]|uniref:hypothetical protein n=1 Tax=Microbacterium hydrocarbonoxydans TaxID=273678 RepID=UPI00203BCA3B|nr:hypothetical protein [Microbacterium hydrocarbonoxydans]MCM3780571.1 hypothetical protein [Microbacterium hydrocarbonoxydans]
MLLLHRSSLLAGPVVVLSLLLAGCSPSPDPSPTPTPAFASEEEAFAAAEEVYRAYLIEVEARAAGDPTADPQQFLIGQALEDDIEGQRALREAGLTVLGTASLRSFDSGQIKRMTPDVDLVARVCVDLASTRVTDTTGADRTPVERPPRAELEIRFTGSSKDLRIASSSATEELAC